MRGEAIVVDDFKVFDEGEKRRADQHVIAPGTCLGIGRKACVFVGNSLPEMGTGSEVHPAFFQQLLEWGDILDVGVQVHGKHFELSLQKLHLLYCGRQNLQSLGLLLSISFTSTVAIKIADGNLHVC